MRKAKIVPGLTRSGRPRRGGQKHARRDARIIRLHVEGVVHPRIAEKYGLTRERVRQIVAMHNLQPRRVFQRRRRAENDARAIVEARRRERARNAKLQALSRAWMRGDSISAIAAAFGMRTANAANALISYRRKHHPQLFPCRKPWVRGNSSAKRRTKSRA